MKESPLRYALSYLGFCLLLAAVGAALFFWSVTALRAPADTAASADVPAERLPAVILDAGHGGEDGGAVGADGTCEKDVNLALTLTLRDMLEAAGVDVLLTRTDDRLLYDPAADYKGHKKSLDLRARLDVAKAYPTARFISLHMNAFPDPAYSGLQVYYAPHDADSQTLAAAIQARTEALLQPGNHRKIKPATSAIYLLDRAPGSAILVECGFLSHAGECAALATPAYRQALSLVLFDAIFSHLATNPR